MSEGAQTARAAAVRRSVAQLVDRYGPDLLDDVRRLRAMLADSVPDAEAEANLLGMALSGGAADRLRAAAASGTATDRAVRAVAAEVERTASVRPDDALWVARTIAEALGLSTSAEPADAVPGDLRVRTPERQYVLRADSRATVGRDPAGTIVVDSPAVSRLHARLERVDGTWQFHDLGSTQGSFVGETSGRLFVIDAETVVVLGQGDRGVPVTLIPVVAEVATDAHRPPVPAGTGPAVGATQRPHSPGDELRVEWGGETRVVGPGAAVTIGREADNDLVARHATVSRHHARLEHVGGRWHLRDVGSSAGTWLAGARVEDVILQGRQSFVLGDAADGDRLVTHAPDPVGASGAERRRSRPRLPRIAPAGPGGGRGRRVTAVVAVLAVLVAIGVATWMVVDRSGGDGGTTSRDDLARATVHLVAGPMSGSGVVIDREKGLILTNAHVAAPASVGQGIAQLRFADEVDADPEEIDVAVADGLDSPAEPRFRAKVVAVDGYLDLAVLEITARASGAKVRPSDLDDLVQVRLADSDAVRTSDEVAFLGYPSASASEAVTYTTGVVSGPVEDPRIDSPRAAINTTATIAPGNSGGLAVDADNRMIGVPTWNRLDGSGNAVLSSFRPINLAREVIAAARSGTEYVSPLSEPGPEGAAVSDLSLTRAGRPGTIVAGCTPLSSDGGPLAMSFTHSGFPGGENTDVAAVLYDLQGEVVVTAETEYPTELPESGCLTVTFDDAVPDGRYRLKVGVGGDLRVLYDGTVTLS